jgi:hypothetical protein
MKKWIVILTAALVLTACSAAASTGSIPYASIPAGMAYASGSEIYFSHTETSDAGVAEKLTNMMKSPVLVVPSLADAPDSMLATVYVFQNGIKGKGPLGYQPDVFDNPPGTAGYSPLRKITFVTWTDESKAVLLKSAEDVLAQADAGLLTLEKSDIVVNMPFMTWDGGKR